MHGMKSRFVIEPSNILFADVYVCNFQPGNFTSWGSERVNIPCEKPEGFQPCLPHKLSKGGMQGQVVPKKTFKASNEALVY